jgi:hypothetical protein
MMEPDTARLREVISETAELDEMLFRPDSDTFVTTSFAAANNLSTVFREIQLT